MSTAPSWELTAFPPLVETTHPNNPAGCFPVPLGGVAAEGEVEEGPGLDPHLPHFAQGLPHEGEENNGVPKGRALRARLSEGRFGGGSTSISRPASSLTQRTAEKLKMLRSRRRDLTASSALRASAHRCADGAPTPSAVQLPPKKQRGSQKPSLEGEASALPPLVGTTHPIPSHSHSSWEGLVGTAGFEPATSSSRTMRATKLRHVP